MLIIPATSSSIARSVIVVLLVQTDAEVPSGLWPTATSALQDSGFAEQPPHVQPAQAGQHCNARQDCNASQRLYAPCTEPVPYNDCAACKVHWYLAPRGSCWRIEPSAHMRTEPTPQARPGCQNSTPLASPGRPNKHAWQPPQSINPGT